MLEKFTVIDLIKTRSASIATLINGTVKFNVQTAMELRYPAYVQFSSKPRTSSSPFVYVMRTRRTP